MGDFMEKKPVEEMDPFEKLEHGDTYQYRGWMNSDNFFKRAVGVVLYNIVGQILIAIPIIIILVFLALALGK
jgi:hypothetical protein